MFLYRVPSIALPVDHLNFREQRIPYGSYTIFRIDVRDGRGLGYSTNEAARGIWTSL